MEATAQLPTPPPGYLSTPVKAGGKRFSDFSGEVELEEWVGLTVADATETVGSQKYGSKPQVVWLFTVDGQEAKGRVAYFTTITTGSMGDTPSKYVAFHDLFGVPIPAEGEPTYITPFIGRRCKGMFEEKSGSKYPQLVRLKRAKE